MMDTRDLNQQPGGQTMDATGAKRAREATPATDATDGGTQKALKHEAQRDGDEVFNPKEATLTIMKSYIFISFLAKIAMKLRVLGVDSSDPESKMELFGTYCRNLSMDEETINQAESARLLSPIPSIIGAIIDMMKQAHDVLKRDFEDTKRKIHVHKDPSVKGMFESYSILLTDTGTEIQNLKPDFMCVNKHSGVIRDLIISLLTCRRCNNNILERIDAEEN